jgi:alginate O-acetyltransferase complex protein AlgI
MLASMAGLHGFEGLPDKATRAVASVSIVHVAIALAVCLLVPNTQQIFARYKPALKVSGAPFPERTRYRWYQWRPTPLFAALTIAFIVVIGLQFDKVSEFIYFQF